MSWDYDKTAYQKQAKADILWRLERLINYGETEGEKISVALIKKYLPALKIPDNRRAFLELILWDKKF